MRGPSRWIATAVVPILVSAGLGACQGSDASRPARYDASTPLPLTLQGLARVEVSEGADAAALLERLHGKRVAPEASFVGRYRGPGRSATLYVSRFLSPASADSLLGVMAEGIGEGTPEFSHHLRFEAGGREVHMVLGQGQVHFFFTRESDLTWLAIDAPVARAGLAEVLGIPESDLSDLLESGGSTEAPGDLSPVP